MTSEVILIPVNLTQIIAQYDQMTSTITDGVDLTGMVDLLTVAASVILLHQSSSWTCLRENSMDQKLQIYMFFWISLRVSYMMTCPQQIYHPYKQTYEDLLVEVSCSIDLMDLMFNFRLQMSIKISVEYNNHNNQ